MCSLVVVVSALSLLSFSLFRLAVQNMVGVESAEEVKKCEEDRDHWCNEDSYFASYSHYQIHEEMLKVRA